ncbi:MAG: SDR family NAD(P)-dependent oxidoreductase [Bacteroidales bacterium]|nr:SDR family NAD(P)-dependent oxidoreductase [Bacteroidales bacterium]
MYNSGLTGKKVLVTGGTSGLGSELVRTLTARGCYVVATGRRKGDFIHDNLRYVVVDFCDLRSVALAIEKIVGEEGGFDIVINNAGVLSPPEFIKTRDGFEYSFQVNFLAHLLVNEIILNKTDISRDILIVAVTSPVYRIVSRDLIVMTERDVYKPFRAYSLSKLYMALMCQYLPERFRNRNLTCIGFDPGVFSSGIYRMQNALFRLLYHIAAPFMKKPGMLAACLSEMIEYNSLRTGNVYDFRKKERSIPDVEYTVRDLFWKDCYNRLGEFSGSR